MGALHVEIPSAVPNFRQKYFFSRTCWKILHYFLSASVPGRWHLLGTYPGYLHRLYCHSGYGFIDSLLFEGFCCLTEQKLHVVCEYKLQSAFIHVEMCHNTVSFITFHSHNIDFWSVVTSAGDMRLLGVRVITIEFDIAIFCVAFHQ